MRLAPLFLVVAIRISGSGHTFVCLIFLRGGFLPVFQQEWSKDRGVAEVCKDEGVAEIMELGGQIGQVLTLVNRKGKRVIVANTHLFGNPDAPHVRILQMQMLMTAVAAARNEAGGDQVMSLSPSSHPPTLFGHVYRFVRVHCKPPAPGMKLGVIRL